MSLDFGTINYWAVIVSAAVAFGLGAAWYGVFAKPWMAATGITQEVIDAHRGDKTGYVVAAVTWIIGVLALAGLIQLADAEGAVEGLWLGLLVGVGIVAATQAPHFIFEFKPLKLFLIDEGYPVVGLAIAGIILGAWQ